MITVFKAYISTIGTSKGFTLQVKPFQSTDLGMHLIKNFAGRRRINGTEHDDEISVAIRCVDS